MDENYRTINKKLEGFRAQKNKVSEQVALSKRDGTDSNNQIVEMRKLGEKVKALEGELSKVKKELSSKLDEDFQVSYFGSEQDVLIKIPGGSENNLSNEIISSLKNSFQFDLRRKDFIGPQIGEELRDQGGLGILAAMLVMMVYIMFRFQFKFAIGALLALVHDVLIVLGFFSIFYIVQAIEFFSIQILFFS